MSRKGRRGLRPEDADLWARVARTARPLHGSKAHGAHREAPSAPAALGEFSATGPAAPDPRAHSRKPIPPFRIGEAHTEPQQRVHLKPAPADWLQAQPVRMDPKTYRQMNRGRLDPDRKIDLHGMTVAEAHPALLRTVLSAHADGARLVLVVTGKGRDLDEGGPIPAPRGILRHQVPLWLSRPPLAAVVLQVTPAHARHGGGGAYYVYLRRAPGVT